MKPGDLVTYNWRGSLTSENIRNPGLVLDARNRWIRILWNTNLVQEFEIMDPEGWEVIREAG